MCSCYTVRHGQRRMVELGTLHAVRNSNAVGRYLITVRHTKVAASTVDCISWQIHIIGLLQNQIEFRDFRVFQYNEGITDPR